MKTVRILFVLFLALFGGSGIFLSCSKSSSNGSGHLQVMLTDGPAGYDAVYIDVQKVEVNVSSDSGTSSGWQTVNVLRPIRCWQMRTCPQARSPKCAWSLAITTLSS